MLQAFSHTFPEKMMILGKIGGAWEKSGHYWEKSHVSWENGNLVNNIVNAPTRPKGAEAPSQQSATRPVRAKALKIHL